MQRDVSPDVPSVVTAERETTWNLQVHEAHIQSRFDAWVTGRPADTLSSHPIGNVDQCSMPISFSSRAKWQAAWWPGSTSTSGGFSTLQISCANRQRG